MDEYLNKLDILMKAHFFDGGILHTSLRNAIIEDDVLSVNFDDVVGINESLKSDLNQLFDDIRLYEPIPF